MPPLRILHVVPYYEQAWAYGGIPRLATTMTRALARRGHSVTVCTTDACDDFSRAKKSEGHVTHGLEVHYFPNLSNRLAYHWQFFTPVRLARYLEKTLGSARTSFDVAHIHGCHHLPGALGARALQRNRIPYVVSPNGTAKPLERRILAKRLFAATAGRHVLSRAARVFAVTDAERAQLLTLGIDETRIRIVPNPIDDEEYTQPADRDGFRRRHGLGPSPVVLFLGKLTPRKGVDVLVRAFAQLTRSDARLVIAGNDMGAGRTLDALVAELRLSARVTRTGLLCGRDRLNALAAADVVVYPSRDEIFGLVPIEALLCRAPVVVCDDSGCGEIITRIGGGRCVSYGDVTALAGSIQAILDSPDVWQPRVRAAAERARALFGAERVSETLERAYADVLDDRGVRKLA